MQDAGDDGAMYRAAFTRLTADVERKYGAPDDAFDFEAEHARFADLAERKHGIPKDHWDSIDIGAVALCVASDAPDIDGCIANYWFNPIVGIQGIVVEAGAGHAAVVTEFANFYACMNEAQAGKAERY